MVFRGAAGMLRVALYKVSLAAACVDALQPARGLVDPGKHAGIVHQLLVPALSDDRQHDPVCQQHDGRDEQDCADGQRGVHRDQQQQDSKARSTLGDDGHQVCNEVKAAIHIRRYRALHLGRGVVQMVAVGHVEERIKQGNGNLRAHSGKGARLRILEQILVHALCHIQKGQQQRDDDQQVGHALAAEDAVDDNAPAAALQRIDVHNGVHKGQHHAHRNRLQHRAEDGADQQQHDSPPLLFRNNPQQLPENRRIL